MWGVMRICLNLNMKFDHSLHRYESLSPQFTDGNQRTAEPVSNINTKLCGGVPTESGKPYRL